MKWVALIHIDIYIDMAHKLPKALYTGWCIYRFVHRFEAHLTAGRESLPVTNKVTHLTTLIWLTSGATL